MVNPIPLGWYPWPSPALFPIGNPHLSTSELSFQRFGSAGALCGRTLLGNREAAPAA